MNFYERRQKKGKYQPDIIRWFQYFDGPFAESVGGIDYCLKAPVWKAERFHQGVILQLVEEVFDPDNPAHLKAQRIAMEYFGIWDF